MTNVGRIIEDFFCNGFFSREYDYNGAEIIAEGDEWIVIRKTSGVIEFGSFQNTERVNGMQSVIAGEYKDKQHDIDAWCAV